MTTINVLKELGLLNVAVVLVIINSPSILILCSYFITNKYKIEEKYVKKESYEKDSKRLYKNIIEPLREQLDSVREDFKELGTIINKLGDTISRHDERIKAINN